MNKEKLIQKIYGIAKKRQVILTGNIVICKNINCILLCYYCKSTLFYKNFLDVTRDILSVNKTAAKNLRIIKKLIKSYGYQRVNTKGVFNVYGDLRSLAVAAGIGKWGDNGLIVNDKYGDNFLISAIFFR